jgi:Mg-chelatase subunit ChlD
MVEATEPMKAPLMPPPPPPIIEDAIKDTSEPLKEIPTPTPPKHAIQSGTLTAGDIDDNLNLDDFQKYVNRTLQKNGDSSLPFISSKKRLKLTVVDDSGKGINRAKVTFGGIERYTNSAGVLHLFPSVDEAEMRSINVEGQTIPVNFSQSSEKRVTLQKTATKPQSLDLMFVIDTTGSMSDEMAYLAKEFEAIISNVESNHPETKIRFGLTLYRDKGDDYVVKDFPFTTDKKTMQKQLADQSANGGGDYPEAMDEGLQKGLQASWKAEDGVRVLFLVADAPPHDEKMKTILPLIKEARDKAVHIYPIGASGVAEKAEYIMRHLALMTEGRYLFLTDDSGVGNSHEEPKVACYQVTRLDQLIRRVIQSELSGKRVEATSDEVIRSVGKFNQGVCEVKEEPIQQNKGN